MIQGVSLILFIWFLSVAIVFQEKIFDEKFFGIAVISMVHLGLKIAILNFDDRFSSEIYKFKRKKLVLPIIVTTSCALMMVRNAIDVKSISIGIDLAMLVVCFYLSK